MSILTPLHAMTSTESRFGWMKEMKHSFQMLKKAMTEPPVLAFPDFGRPFVVETDASFRALGAVFSKAKEDGKMHLFQYACRTLSSTEKKYFACKRKALAVIFTARKFCLHLMSTELFVVLTDQQGLKALLEKAFMVAWLAGSTSCRNVI